MNFLDYIRLGIKAIDIFDYEGHDVKIRPLTSYEMDESEENGYSILTPGLAKLIMRIRLKDISLTKELVNLPADMFTSIDNYYKEVDYWLVYHSMKDFQPEDFSINDVRNMRYVHDIAMKILNMSSLSDKYIIEILKSDKGEKLAKIIIDFHVPIIDEAWKMTPLQYRFCEISTKGVDKFYSQEDFEKAVHGSSLPEAIKKLVGK